MAVVWTGGAANDSWSDPLNWDASGGIAPAAGVPVDGDDVVIPDVGDATELVVFDTSVAGSGVQLNSLVANEPFQLRGDRLTLSGAGPFDFNAPTELLFGTLELNQEVTMHSTVAWQRTILRSPEFTGTLVWAGGNTISGSSKLIEGLTLELDSDTVWTGGEIQLRGNAVISNQPTRHFDMQFDGLLHSNSGSGAERFQNLGAFTKSAGTQFGTINTFFQHESAEPVTASSGTLRLRVGGSSAGEWVAEADSQIFFQGNTFEFNSGSSFSGQGTADFGSQQTVLGADLQSDVATLRQSGSTLQGDFDLTVNGLFEWRAGTQVGSTDSRTIVNGGMLLSSANARGLDGRTLEMNSDATMAGGVLLLSNEAVINNSVGATFEIQSGNPSFGNGVIQGSDGGSEQFNNSGTVVRSSGLTIASVQTNFRNQGTVVVESGIFQLEKLLDYDASSQTLHGGEYRVDGTSGPAALQWPQAHVATNEASIHLAGADSLISDSASITPNLPRGLDALLPLAMNASDGTLRLSQGAQLTTLGELSNEGDVIIESDSALTIAAGESFLQTGGSTSLSDPTAMLNADLIDLRAGLLSGTGVITGEVNNQGTISPGVSPGLSSGVLRVDGNLTTTGELVVEITGRGSNAGGVAGTDFDQLDVRGDFTAGGEIVLEVAEGLTPVLADLYDVVVSTGSTTGQFVMTQGTFLGSGQFLRPTYDNDGVDVLVTAEADTDLAITSVDVAAAINAEQTLPVSIHYQNGGQATAENVTLSWSNPDNWVLVAGAGCIANADGLGGSCELGTLADGAQGTAELTFLVAGASGIQSLEFLLDSQAFDRDLTNNRQTVGVLVNNEPLITSTSGQQPVINDVDADAAAGYGVAYGASTLLHSGEYRLMRTDLAIPGRGQIHFSLSRQYRSQLAYDGPLGYGWDFNYNERLHIQSNGDLRRSNGYGHVDSWIRNSDGSYTAPAGYFSMLMQDDDGSFVLREPDGFKRIYDAAGLLQAHEDRFGNRMLFLRDDAGELDLVVDAYGREIDFVFDLAADGRRRLLRVADYTGREVVYGYDAAGNLTSVRSPVVTGTSTGNDFPAGRTEQYSYDTSADQRELEHNLLSVTFAEEVAANGPAAIQISYGIDPAEPLTFDRVLTETVGGTNATGVAAGGTSTFGYEALNAAEPLGNPAISRLKTTVTERNGNVLESFFNELNHQIAHRRLTRGLRAGEPTFYEGTATYDADGQLLRQTFPEGNAIELVYGQGARAAQQNLIELRQVADVDRGGGDDLVTTWSYEPLFQQVASVTDPRGNATGFVPPIGAADADRYTTRFLYDYQEGGRCRFGSDVVRH